MKKIQLGKTGEFPQGKISDTDEGGLQFAIFKTKDKSNLIIEFNTPVVWMGMPIHEAKEFALAILKIANET
jgi:hypothetical protein